MDSKTIIEVVDKLVGSIHAIGSTEVDNKRYENLRCLEDVAWHIIDELIEECNNSTRYEGSMKASGEQAIKILRSIASEINISLGMDEDEEN